MTAVTLHANVTISFPVPRDGRVSLAVYDTENRMVRTLLTGKPLAIGKHAITWDGLDRYGHALPAGDYTWKLLATDGLRAEFITQVGQNVDPAWEKDGVLSWSRAGGDVFGPLTGNARRVPGKKGRAIELQARGEFEPALFPIDEELRLPDTDYTVAFWFKTVAKDARLCEAKRYSSYNNRWSDHVVSLNQGKVRFQLQGDQALQTLGTFNENQWHHVVTTVGQGGQRLHVDGKLIATGKLTQRTKTSNRLGLDLGPGSGNATVTIDELQIFGRSQTPSEIVRHSY